MYPPDELGLSSRRFALDVSSAPLTLGAGDTIVEPPVPAYPPLLTIVLFSVRVPPYPLG